MPLANVGPRSGICSIPARASANTIVAGMMRQPCDRSGFLFWAMGDRNHVLTRLMPPTVRAIPVDSAMLSLPLSLSCCGVQCNQQLQKLALARFLRHDVTSHEKRLCQIFLWES